MYKAIVVDDNQNTIRSLQISVNWQECGFELVGVAYDGAQGCRLIEQLHPDLVITDIRMPGTDGFALMEQKQELLAHARVIVITAYDKFQYATQAIRLSAFDFILKPIDNDELRSSLLRAHASLDSERNVVARGQQMEWFRRRARMIGQLTTAPSSNSEDALPAFCEPGLSAYCFLAVGGAESISQPMLQRLNFETYPPNLDVLSVVLEDDLVMFCGFRGPDSDWRTTAGHLAQRLKQRMPDMSCAVSSLYTDLSNFRAACREARQALLKCKMLHDPTDVMFCKGTPQEERRPHIADMQQLSQKMADSNMDAEQAWKKMLEGTNNNLRYLRILLMMYAAKILQKRFANARIADTVDASMYDIPQITTVDGAEKWFFRFWEQVDQAEKNSSSMSVLIRNVLSYVNTYATDGISLESVAKHFHVSPNYLSALVRKETGKTYQQHVIETKIRVSKQLLDDTRMHIEDISRAVGYENYISFYNMFRRMEGCTPSAYRMRNRSTENKTS